MLTLGTQSSPPRVGHEINHDEWVPRWARNSCINLTLNQDCAIQNKGNRTAVHLQQQFKRAVETTNHFIMSKEGGNKKRAKDSMIIPQS